jgi:hypothetical protein
LESNVNDANTDQFRHSQSPRETEVQHCAITNADPANWIRSIQNGLHFLRREVPDEAHVRFLGRNRQDAANLFERRRHPILYVPHERFDRCEPDVSGTSTVSARCFQVIQEVHYERGIYLLQLQLRRRDV